MDTLRTFPAVVEEAGWDEAFLAVNTDDPESFARRIQQTVLERTRLWCSIGIGDNRLRAKLASGFAKPKGVYRLTREEWFDVMGHRSTRELWGIGKKTADKLSELGLRTVRELADADDERLARRFGPNTGPWLRSLAAGESSRPVTDEPYIARGHGHERTYQENITDQNEIRERLGELVSELMEDLHRDGRPVARVVVKVRFAPFFTSTHGAALLEPTSDPDVVRAAAMTALTKFERDRPVRLLGVRAEFAV
jgi:DNA polymerase-4